MARPPRRCDPPTRSAHARGATAPSAPPSTGRRPVAPDPPSPTKDDTMNTRRTLAATAAALALLTLPAVAQDWKAQYPELTLGVIPAENASGTADRWAPLTAYLT